jgi:hypothetical protein
VSLALRPSTHPRPLSHLPRSTSSTAAVVPSSPAWSDKRTTACMPVPGGPTSRSCTPLFHISGPQRCPKLPTVRRRRPELARPVVASIIEADRRSLTDHNCCHTQGGRAQVCSRRCRNARSEVCSPLGCSRPLYAVVAVDLELRLEPLQAGGWR